MSFVIAAILVSAVAGYLTSIPCRLALSRARRPARHSVVLGVLIAALLVVPFLDLFRPSTWEKDKVESALVIQAVFVIFCGVGMTPATLVFLHYRRKFQDAHSTADPGPVSKRTECIIVCAVAAAIVAVTLKSLFYRPPMPASWDNLRAGMTQEEVESLVNLNEVVLMREQMMELEHDAPMLGVRGGWWLRLDFDGATWQHSRFAQLRSATAGYGTSQFRTLCGKTIRLL